MLDIPVLFMCTWEKQVFNGFVSFDGSSNSILIPETLDGTERVVASASHNVNVWVSYNSGWYIHVSDSSFVGKVYYSIQN